MLDKNIPVTFFYINPDMLAGKTDIAIEEFVSHHQGRELAGINDIIKDNERYCNVYTWGQDGRYMMCRDGMYVYHEGSYLQVCKY